MVTSRPLSPPIIPSHASPAPTEIAYEISHIKQLPEEQMVGLIAAGVKVRDFVHKPTPNALKAPEVFDHVPNLIALDRHLRKPLENYSLLSVKSLFWHQDRLGRARGPQGEDAPARRRRARVL
jgi:hypothetical protein